MLRDSKTLKSCPAVFREVYPIKGFLKLPGPGNALASKPGSRVVAVQLNFGTGEGHCLASSLSLSSIVVNTLVAFCRDLQ